MKSPWTAWSVLACVAVAGGAWIPQDTSILKTDYVANYIGVFLGLAIAIITLLHGVADKLLEQVVNDYRNCRDKDPERAKILKEIAQSIKSLFNGLNIVTMWLFVWLVAIIALGLIEAFNPKEYWATWPLPFSYGTSQIVMAVKVGALFFSLFTTWLVIRNLFKVINAAALARGSWLEDKK